MLSAQTQEPDSKSAAPTTYMTICMGWQKRMYLSPELQREGTGGLLSFASCQVNERTCLKGERQRTREQNRAGPPLTSALVCTGVYTCTHMCTYIIHTCATDIHL